ncbi:hypothetical protein XH89_20030 [Bradyrhizobium sp. CCBAU 53340]|uniref:helix-turn-helix domain-containing protein n=1 Tax=Bradyrhizobium sp. CCBAU 53340 TaxID=1325112 RepID=UPI00188D2CB9|nr:helix-turn-helix domain-containing protein [Bradyrhizobium sp. CCBAU 53340]QOZ45516.1 hypothetical protein XH89_20030 [Bradyrhizobium sp. CCBAU 53340]
MRDRIETRRAALEQGGPETSVIGKSNQEPNQIGSAIQAPNDLLTKWRLLQAIVTDSALDPVSKLVATRLLDHCNTKTGRCDPSYQTIADAIGYSRRHVIRAIQRLASAGWVQVNHRGRGRQARSNQFSFSWQRADGGFLSAVKPAKMSQGAPSARTIKPGDAEVVTPMTPAGDNWVTIPSDKGVTTRDAAVTTGVTPMSPETRNSNQEELIQEPKQARQSRPTPAAILFGECRSYLETSASLSADQARRLLGKWRQKHMDSVIIDAISRAMRHEAQDPVAFITACLTRSSSPSHSLGAMSAIAAIERYET